MQKLKKFYTKNLAKWGLGCNPIQGVNGGWNPPSQEIEKS